MRVVKLNAVKARGLCAPRGGRKQRRQRLRQVANMRQVHVRNAFAEALHERFVLASGQNLFPAGLAEFKQAGCGIKAHWAGEKPLRVTISRKKWVSQLHPGDEVEYVQEPVRRKDIVDPENWTTG